MLRGIFLSARWVGFKPRLVPEKKEIAVSRIIGWKFEMIRYPTERS